MSVRRFLVTGTDAELTHFHFGVCLMLNCIERRGQTVLYTCMDEDRERAIGVAKRQGITLQEMDNEAAETRNEEVWKVVVQGGSPAWEPEELEG